MRAVTELFQRGFLLGAFADYLNLEVTQLYVRRRIARLFFRGHNPHGLKSGLRVGLTARHALMIFSLATVAGNVGTDRRMEYTVLNDTVNVASRIESQTKIQQTDILVSEAVVSALDRAQFGGVAFETCGPILLRGKSVPMELFRLG